MLDMLRWFCFFPWSETKYQSFYPNPSRFGKLQRLGSHQRSAVLAIKHVCNRYLGQTYSSFINYQAFSPNTVNVGNIILSNDFARLATKPTLCVQSILRYPLIKRIQTTADYSSFSNNRANQPSLRVISLMRGNCLSVPCNQVCYRPINRTLKQRISFFLYILILADANWHCSNVNLIWFLFDLRWIRNSC